MLLRLKLPSSMKPHESAILLCVELRAPPASEATKDKPVVSTQLDVGPLVRTLCQAGLLAFTDENHKGKLYLPWSKKNQEALQTKTKVSLLKLLPEVVSSSVAITSSTDLTASSLHAAVSSFISVKLSDLGWLQIGDVFVKDGAKLLMNGKRAGIWPAISLEISPEEESLLCHIRFHFVSLRFAREQSFQSDSSSSSDEDDEDDGNPRASSYRCLLPDCKPVCLLPDPADDSNTSVLNSRERKIWKSQGIDLPKGVRTVMVKYPHNPGTSDCGKDSGCFRVPEVCLLLAPPHFMQSRSSSPAFLDEKERVSNEAKAAICSLTFRLTSDGKNTKLVTSCECLEQPHEESEATRLGVTPLGALAAPKQTVETSNPTVDAPYHLPSGQSFPGFRSAIQQVDMSSLEGALSPRIQIAIAPPRRIPTLLSHQATDLPGQTDCEAEKGTDLLAMQNQTGDVPLHGKPKLASKPTQPITLTIPKRRVHTYSSGTNKSHAATASAAGSTNLVLNIKRQHANKVRVKSKKKDAGSSLTANLSKINLSGGTHFSKKPLAVKPQGAAASSLKPKLCKINFSSITHSCNTATKPFTAKKRKAGSTNALGPGAKSTKGQNSLKDEPVKKAKRDRKAPKKAKSAYVLWTATARTLLVQENPNLDSKEVTKLLKVKWKTVDKQEKKKWEEAAKEDKKRFDTEQEAYLAKLAQHAPVP
eukprot:g29502.t1